MDLLDAWPLFRLRLTTPRLELRIVRDDDLAPLLEAALAGVHDPGRSPFAVPWAEAPADELRRNFVQHQWRQRTTVKPDDWTLNFAIVEDGRPVGVQDMSAREFAVRRTVETGSWLTRDAQGRGLGTEMRAAVLVFAFDHLGAEVAESSAVTWNSASLGVSRTLGYSLNGVTRLATRSGEVEEEQRVRLLATDFVRPDWQLEVAGWDAAKHDLLSAASQ